jgi:peptide/nickel transport system permease protein
MASAHVTSAKNLPAGRNRNAFLAGLGRILRDPFSVAALLIYLLLVLVAIFADQLMTHDPTQILFRTNGRVASNQPTGAAFLLGTTNLGRDIYSQLVAGSRNALMVGITAAISVAAIGTLVGLLSGYFGGRIDAFLMRLADVALAIPFLPFVIVLSGFFRANTWNVVIAVALLLWPNTARVIRAQVLTVKERAYVEAARVTGASDMRILFVHVAPNILPLTFLYGSVAIGWAILTEAAVSFVGFGDPSRISWGFMLQDAFVSQALSRGSWNWFLPPGICIILVVIAGFFLARGAEEVLFPKLRS